MASVTADRVRVRLGLTATDIADNEVATFIDEAAAYLANQTGLTLDPNNCTEDQAKAKLKHGERRAKSKHPHHRR